MRPELPQLAIVEANLALQDLGICEYRVERIVKETQADSDADSYLVTLEMQDDTRRILRLKA